MIASKHYLTFLGIVSVFALVASQQSNNDLQCSYNTPNVPANWIVMAPQCVASVTDLINTKMTNSMQYLAFAAFFSRDSVNRLGFADVFYEHADICRDDAIKLIDYVVMRGKFTNPNILQLSYMPAATQWNSVADALTAALQMEANTTNKYHNLITTCEQYGLEDYNIANWLSQYFLQEQYDVQKFIADLTSSLIKMRQLHQELGEFFLDSDL